MSSGKIDFVKNPDLTQLQNEPSLIDEVGKFLGEGLVRENFAEHQLRRIHSELIRLNKLAASLRAYADTVPREQITELKRGLVKLSYITTYQHARQGPRKNKSIDNYFNLMKNLVTKLMDSPEPHKYIELVFNVSESIIAYYNFIKEMERERYG
ncbi:MAG: type III-A CRISPR-associated protein Csm2 [Candidatus Caldarchaeum sp.]